MRKYYLPFEVLHFFRYIWLLESSSVLHDQLFVAATHMIYLVTQNINLSLLSSKLRSPCSSHKSVSLKCLLIEHWLDKDIFAFIFLFQPHNPLPHFRD